MTVLAIAIGFLGGVVIASNYGIALRFILRGRRGSLVPILGGLLVCVGMLLYPGGLTRPWAWVPLLLDIGCLPMMVAAACNVGRGR
jgi:hypothetical protein